MCALREHPAKMRDLQTVLIGLQKVIRPESIDGHEQDRRVLSVYGGGNRAQRENFL
jgi:hypothetical protein